MKTHGGIEGTMFATFLQKENLISFSLVYCALIYVQNVTFTWLIKCELFSVNHRYRYSEFIKYKEFFICHSYFSSYNHHYDKISFSLVHSALIYVQNVTFMWLLKCELFSVNHRYRYIREWQSGKDMILLLKLLWFNVLKRQLKQCKIKYL